MSGFSEFTFWSPQHDRTMTRLSMWNERGGEFYQILPRDNGRHWRERREQALDMIDEAIRLKLEPGEVVAT